MRKDKLNCLGFEVSKTIRKEIKSNIDKVNIENRKYKSRLKQYSKVRKIIKELGFNAKDLRNKWQFERLFEEKLERIKEGCPPGLVENLERMQNQIRESLKILRDNT